MRKHIHLKYLSWVLVIVLLTLSLTGVQERAHAMHGHAVITAKDGSCAGRPEPQESPCTPHEHQEESDCCDSCVNCTCHAPLAVQPLQLRYNPVIVDLHIHTPFNFLPNVYLPLFVPPDSAIV